MRIAIVHPFTPSAAGVVEKSVPTYHSQPHLKALEYLSERCHVECEMGYFTNNLFDYSLKQRGITFKFYPVNFTLNGDHRKWKKQGSKKCLKAFKKDPPDVTIINMSGHSSPFSYELSKVILDKGKTYIAMLGGQHYTDNLRNREYYANAHHILVHTIMQKKEMENMALFKGIDIRVFPLGVDCDVFRPLKGVELASKSEAKLLYVGRIVEWKRVHLAIKAVKTLVEHGFKDAHLNIIGPVISKAYFDKLELMIKKLELNKHVTFLGHKEHEELPPFFQEADLFTLPSFKETFGMVMIESMACGTPVAGMNCPGGPADVIDNGVDGILSTAEDYDKDILNYFENNTLQRKMSVNARNKVLDTFSLDATYGVLKNSIESLMPK
ncbi:glycosyltransferase family 4 protein [Mangrovimonas xylaniphaga]|uniref:glycosyltransferase family 4 protein n=1 Tax=Mangrovimonas xylaniphaga TaxID=1645915 RepID=UPI0006B579E3|nr:glycosyltransferase family 4 protein [Mangrovimonas xylaniphaga]